MQVQAPNSGEGLKKAGIVSCAPHAHRSRTPQKRRTEHEQENVISRFMHFRMILCMRVPHESLSLSLSLSVCVCVCVCMVWCVDSCISEGRRE